MHPRFFAPSRRSWPLAIFLSMLLHAIFFLPFLVVPLGGQGGLGGRLGLDTRAPGSGVEVQVILVEPRRRPELAPSVSSVVAPTPVTPGREVAVPQLASAAAEPAPVLTRQPGESEEEEGSAVAESRSRIRQNSGEPNPNSGECGYGAPGIGTTSFFQIATSAASVVYLIDRSASMGPSGSLAMAKVELRASLEHLPATTRFQVIAYNRSAEPFLLSGRLDLALASPENKRQAAHLLDGLASEGGTDHFLALKQALSLRPEVIFFLTDADDMRPQQIRAVTLLNHGRAVVNTIEVGTGPRRNEDGPLQTLARDNQGIYRFVPSGR
jgi:hypothetical protein